MLAIVRQFAKSWVAGALMVLLILSFIIFEAKDIFSGGTGNHVIVAGSRSMDPGEFKQTFERYKQQVEKQQGRAISTEDMDKAGVTQRLLNEMTLETSMAAWLEKVGIRPSDKLVQQKIEKTPRFFDPITGKLDKAEYAKALAEIGLSPTKYEALIKDDFASASFAQALSSGLRAPRIYSALQAAYMLETRDARMFVVTPQVLGKLPTPTDAQLQKFYKDNEDRLRAPEFRQAVVVRFTPAQVMDQVKVDEATLQKSYEFEKDSLSAPEKRSFIQIAAKDQKAAEQAVTALKAGKTPDEAAKLANAQVIKVDGRPRTAVSDPAVQASVFNLKIGEVSPAIKTPLGYTVLKVTAILPGKTISFAEARPQLEAKARKNAAIEKVNAQVEAYEAATKSGLGLKEAAAKAGVQLLPLPPVSAQGAAPNGQPLPLPPLVLKTLYDTTQGADSELVDAGQGEYFALHVEKVIPSAVAPLNEVKAQLAQAWTAREVSRLLQEKSDQLAARLKKGEKIEQVAASINSPVKTLEHMSRNPQGSQVPQQLLAQVFGATVGKSFTAQVQPVVFVVGTLDKVHAPEVKTAAVMTEQARPQVSMEVLQDVGSLVRTATKSELKAKNNPDLARSALGLAKPDDKSKKK